MSGRSRRVTIVVLIGAAVLVAALAVFLAPEEPSAPAVVWARRVPAAAVGAAGVTPGLDFDADDVRTSPGGAPAEGHWSTMTLGFGSPTTWTVGLQRDPRALLSRWIGQIVRYRRGRGGAQHYVQSGVIRLGPDGAEWHMVARYPFWCPDGADRRPLCGVWSVECTSGVDEVELRADGTVRKPDGGTGGVWSWGDGVVLIRRAGNESVTDLGLLAPDLRSFEGLRDLGVAGSLGGVVTGKRIR